MVKVVGAFPNQVIMLEKGKPLLKLLEECQGKFDFDLSILILRRVAMCLKYLHSKVLSCSFGCIPLSCHVSLIGCVFALVCVLGPWPGLGPLGHEGRSSL